MGSSALKIYRRYINFIILYLITVATLVYGQKQLDRVYVGERTCRECHHLQGNRNQFNPWRLSKHARAFTSLFKPEAKQIAELSGIDIEPYTSPDTE